MATTKTQQDVIKRFMRSLDTTNAKGEAALNEAIKYATGGYFSSFSAAVKQMVADCKNMSANNFLLKKCGINLSNKDTGAITGSDAGGKKIKTAASIVPESGSLNSKFKDTSFETKYGVTFSLAKSSLTSDEKYIWQALKTWWAEKGLALIEESYGFSFKDSDATLKEIIIAFDNSSSSSYLAATGLPKNNKLTITINKAHYNNFKSTDVNGISSKSGAAYLDRTIAHELTHAIMMTKVNNYSNLPSFITEGMAELTHGIDDVKGDALKTLAGDYKTLKNSLNLKISSGSPYISGYMFLRYLAKQGAQNFADTTAADNAANVTIKSSALTLTKNYSGNTLDLDDYSAKIKTVNAGAVNKKIMIYGNDNANKIIGGAGNDTLIGGKGNDSLWGDDGADKFIYSSGDGADIIFGFDNKDTLTFDNLDFKTSYKNGVITFTVEGGSVTLKDFTATTFHVNNKTLTIKGGQLK